MQSNRQGQGTKNYLVHDRSQSRPTVQDYQVESDVYPQLDNDQYYTIKVEDGRKIPRSPPANPDWVDKYVSAHDEDVWYSLDRVLQWTKTLDGHIPATVSPDIPSDSDSDTVENLVLMDFDNVRNPDTGEIHGDVWAFIDDNEIHSAISYSGTGVHCYCKADIPVDIKPSCTIELSEWVHGEEPELELYAANRPIALTGEHIKQTPVEITHNNTIVSILEQHSSEQNNDEYEVEVDESVEDVKKTTDFDDITGAIDKITPGDITIKSSVTNERANGTKDIDPCWEHSDSGTRVGELDDCWIYRPGDQPLNAIQLVALEERLVSTPGDIPSGDDFFEAVEELRKRGANIPKYVSGGFDSW